MEDFFYGIENPAAGRLGKVNAALLGLKGGNVDDIYTKGLDSKRNMSKLYKLYFRHTVSRNQVVCVQLFRLFCIRAVISAMLPSLQPRVC